MHLFLEPCLSLADICVVHCRSTVQAALQDCRCAFDLDSRNAMWGAALHLAAGVAPFKRPPITKPGAKGPDVVTQLPEDEAQPQDGPAGVLESQSLPIAPLKMRALT